MAWLLLLLSSLCSTCTAPPPRSATVLITLPAAVHIARQQLSFVPSDAVMAARIDRRHRLWIETDGRAFQLQAPELCGVKVPAIAPGTFLQKAAMPVLDLGPNYRSQVGYDAQVEIRARPGCEAGSSARITWSQTEGPTPQRVQTLNHGQILRVRVLPLRHFFRSPLPAGVVAVSPRTQGRYVFEAEVHLPQAAPFKRKVTITSQARASGLPSLAVSQRVILGQSDLSVRSAPPRSNAQVQLEAGVATFMADVAGRYLLVDTAGSTLELHALPHERTPLDCGRAECHPNEVTAARSSAMSAALERALASSPAAPSCVFECHVVGEAGLHDGGFLDLGRALGVGSLAETPVSKLPTPLRRLAGVGCTACHGPGTVPPPGDRARILRADVCATCHDAPPTYVHVAQWRQSRMARSDQNIRTRTTNTCAGCHTTGGFLNALGIRRREDRSQDPDGQSVGISCAACHAPHGAHLPRALLRATQVAVSLSPSPALDSTPTALCTQCHAPLSDELYPSASSAAIWLGKVRMPKALGGGTIEGPAPHAALPGGCMACHGASADGTPSAVHHAFGVDDTLCATCHGDGSLPRGYFAPVHEQALALLAELDGACADRPAQPQGQSHTPARQLSCRAPLPIARARYTTSLIAEDPAASAHNLPFAQRLLNDGRRALASQLGPHRADAGPTSDRAPQSPTQRADR